MDIYKDTRYKINFSIPWTVADDIKRIEKAIEENDDLEFTCCADELEASTKQAVVNGNITDSQLDIIFKRYGLR